MVTQVTRKLKNIPEQVKVVGPLVEALINKGWQLDQLHFGKHEFRVPKNPSEASKREKGQSYEGFPVDIAVFDSPERLDDPAHLLIIIETKQSDENAGVSQLETYLSLEPHAKLGVWANTADLTQPAIFVFRTQSGVLQRRRRLLSELPAPAEPIEDRYRRLSFKDLSIPSSEGFKKVVEDLLDRVVVEDGSVTRREEQLDQLCSLLLLKLYSDKLSKLSHEQTPEFRVMESATRTAEHIRERYQDFVNFYPETFTTQQDKELRLTDQTIHRCVGELQKYRLIDAGVGTVSVAFQVLRLAALRSEDGQYFTPHPVIQAGVKLMKVGIKDLVIDPACGTGGFLLEILMQMNGRFPGREAELSKWAQTNLHGIDKDGIAVKLTKAIMQIAGDGSANIARGDAVRTHLWTRDYPYLSGGKFANGRFNVVITNPPFGHNLKVSAEDMRLAKQGIGARGGTEFKDLEIGLVFLQRAYELLHVDGRLGIILPETYFFSPSYRFLFDWLRPRLKPEVVLDIPMDAFQGFCRAKTNFYVFRKVK